jgi:hypothetical protein
MKHHKVAGDIVGVAMEKQNRTFAVCLRGSKIPPVNAFTCSTFEIDIFLLKMKLLRTEELILTRKIQKRLTTAEYDQRAEP